MLVLCVAALSVGSASSVAIAGNGHGGGGSGNNPSTGGQHGQDCAPGYHDTGTGTCEHNGGGGGNCGDNQSGNDNGLGNNGNDNGFGHKGDVCDPGNPTPPPPGPPNPPPGPPNPPGPPGSPPSGGTPSHPNAPSVTCAASLRLGRKHVAVGRRTLLTVRVIDARKVPLRSMRVIAHGAGVRLSVMTDSSGRARLTIRPTRAGAIRITVAQGSTCSSLSGLVLATAVAKAHKPDFTG
jgi:hypothetical protein